MIDLTRIPCKSYQQIADECKQFIREKKMENDLKVQEACIEAKDIQNPPVGK